MMAIHICLLAKLLLAQGPDQGQNEEWLGNRSATLQRVAPSRLGFRLLWQRAVSEQGNYRKVLETFGQPAVDRSNARVFVGTAEGHLLALTLHHGQEIWRYQQQLPPMDGGASLVTLPESGRLLSCFTGRSGHIVCLDSQDGTLVWQQQLDGAIRGIAQYVAGHGLLVQTSEPQVTLLDVHTGGVLWQYTQPQSPSLRIDGQARMLIHQDRCLASFADGSLVALAMATGVVIWQRAPDRSDDVFVDADADPQLVGDTLLVALYHAGILALNWEDGSVKWQRSVPAVVRLASLMSTGIASSADGFVWCFDAASGQLRWRVQLPPGRFSRLTQAGSLWLFTHSDLGLIALDGLTGKPMYQAGMVGLGGQDIAQDEDIYASVSLSGYLHVWQHHRLQ